MNEVKRYKAGDLSVQRDVVMADDFDRVTADLEQRRYAEQKACQAAERRVEELEGLLRRAYRSDLAARHCQPYTNSKLMDDIEAALDPTTEVTSHE